MSVRAASPAYIIFQLAAAIALIALCVGYGFEDHQLDQCRQNLTKQTQAAKPGPAPSGHARRACRRKRRDCEGAHPKEVREMTRVPGLRSVHGKAACHVCGRPTTPCPPSNLSGGFAAPLNLIHEDRACFASVARWQAGPDRFIDWPAAMRRRTRPAPA